MRRQATLKIRIATVFPLTLAFSRLLKQWALGVAIKTGEPCLLFCAVGILFFGADLAKSEICMAMPDLIERRSQHLSEINRIRARNGLESLLPDFRLDMAAQDYACLLARSGHFAHQGPDGSEPGTRTVAAGYDFCLVAENLAKGQRTVSEAISAWVQSPGHWANIRLGPARHLGFGMAPLAGGGSAATGGLSTLFPDAAGAIASTTPYPVHGYVWVELFASPC
ncbi:CAP domain-containing protein [Vannielia litorea]|uniref:CAP domain-containing protein n=1 Tax=Vannielia litorea TaxID=1217970 RepID=UPI0021BD1954|nr:CAP domain-containing protein [Vannielia litorea]